jgi:PRTRC system protein E
VFTELMPLLAGRTVLITVAKADDKTLCVNVIPVQAKADKNPALIPPLTYTGSPEELDAELGRHLAGYVQVHQQPGRGQGNLSRSNLWRPRLSSILFRLRRTAAKEFLQNSGKSLFQTKSSQGFAERL